MKQELKQKHSTVTDYNNSRKLVSEIIDGKTFRRMKRKNRNKTL